MGVLLRILTLAAACLAAILSLAGVRAAETSVSERVALRVGLETLYLQFGATVAQSARQGGVGDAAFVAAWEGATVEAFTAVGLDTVLATRLAADLDGAELEAIEAFFASGLGARIGTLEAAVQRIPADQQIALIARGQAMLLAAPPLRQALLQEVLTLRSAAVTFAILKESLRALALGLHLSKHGEIAVDWEEIDATVSTELAAMEQSLRDASLGTLAVALSPLTNAELSAYVAFLRAPATRKFQTLTALTIGQAIHEAMGTLGTALAGRLSAVKA